MDAARDLASGELISVYSLICRMFDVWHASAAEGARIVPVRPIRLSVVNESRFGLWSMSNIAFHRAFLEASLGFWGTA